MDEPEREAQLTDIADELLAGPEWERWLAERPEAAAEVALLRQTRLLLADLRSKEVALPPDFEARVLAQLRRDATLRALLSFGLPQLGAALLEFLSALFGLLPQPADEPPPQPRSV